MKTNDWRFGALLAVLAPLPYFAAIPGAAAQDAARIDAIERQMRSLQNELARLRREAAAREAETRAAQQAAEQARNEAQAAQRQAAALAPPAGTPAAQQPGRLTFPNLRPTFTSSDGRFQASLGARMHYDIGGYIRDRAGTPNTRGVPNLDEFGSNLRRGRLYFAFRYDDFTFNITPEFGGSPDGGATLYEANLNWSPIRPLTLSVGYLKPLVTLADSTSSNDYLFLERPAVSVIATSISAGSSRSGAGVRWVNERFMAQTFLTGQTFGQDSTAQGTPDQTGITARIAGRPYRDDDIDVHLGFSGSYAFDIRRTTTNNAFGQTPVLNQNLSLNDRAGELRIDNAARLVATGNIPADTAYVFGPEFALRWRNLFLQGEYTQIGVDQSQVRGLQRPDLTFQGGYVEASWVITGEPRRYSTSAAAFVRPRPAKPFSLREGTWGAFELAARYSVVDLNSNVTRGRSAASTGGVFGGRQELFGLSLSWYPNDHIRWLLGWNIVNVDRLSSNGLTQIGQRFHTLALRTQVTF